VKLWNVQGWEPCWNTTKPTAHRCNREFENNNRRGVARVVSVSSVGISPLWSINGDTKLF
jgi:hypothetical protein